MNGQVSIQYVWRQSNGDTVEKDDHAEELHKYAEQQYCTGIADGKTSGSLDKTIGGVHYRGWWGKY